MRFTGAGASPAQSKSGGIGATTSGAPSASLFGQKAVPANQVRNAFYTPPAPTVAPPTKTSTTNTAKFSTSAQVNGSSPSHTGAGASATNGKAKDDSLGGGEPPRRSLRDGDEDVEMEGGDADRRSDGGETVDDGQAPTELNSSQQTQKVNSMTDDEEVPQFSHSVFVTPVSAPISTSAAASTSRRKSHPRNTEETQSPVKRTLPKRYSRASIN